MDDNINGDKKISTYLYKFRFDNNVEKKFQVQLDSQTMDLVQENQKNVYPGWTELSFFKCPNCSLDENQQKFCPIAVNLIEVINYFSNFKSYEEVDVIIETKERKYMKHTTLQSGLSSLIGIYMVTSGCSIMEKLKPMVCYHLPFATEKETVYRVISMYLLAQYFLFKRGKNVDWELKNLIDIYNEIQIVNWHFCRRLSSINMKDASLNAVIILNCFAGFIENSIDKNMLDEIESLFKAYFD